VRQSALREAKPFSDVVACSSSAAETIQRRAALPFVPSPVGAIVHIPAVALGCEMGRQGDGLDFDRLPLLTGVLTNCPVCFQSIQTTRCQDWCSTPEANRVTVS